MTDKLVQWIRDLTIRRKLLAGVAIVLALNAYLGLYALNRLGAVGSVARDALANGSRLAAVDQIIADTRSTILVLVLITVGIGVAVALLLGRLIADPFTALGMLAEKVAKGDLTVDIRSLSRDEVGWLEHIMRQMVKSLREMVTQITSASRTVATSAEEISSTTVQIARGAETQSSSTEETSATMVEMAAQMQHLAKNAEALAANVDETSASIQEMSATLGQTAQNGEVLVQAVDEAVSTLTSMIDRFGAIAQRVHMVDDVSQRSAAEARARGVTLQGSIGSIGDRSREIGKIVKVIDWIADQTNLLALNAAVEAARAGDAGRGFAVVADEVRRLAERCMQATQEIGEVVEMVQRETEASVRLTDEVVGGLVGSIGKTSELVTDAARATDEQAAGAKEVLKIAGHMSALTRQIAGAVKENAVGAREISHAADKMNQLTHQMSESVLEQKRGGEQIVKSVESIAMISRQNLVAVEQMSSAAKALAGESEGLQQRVQAFHI
jgi:methyl-accepting chemotaxis protein